MKDISASQICATCGHYRNGHWARGGCSQYCCPTGFVLLGDRAVLNKDDIILLNNLMNHLRDCGDREELTDEEGDDLYDPLQQLLADIGAGKKNV